MPNVVSNCILYDVNKIRVTNFNKLQLLGVLKCIKVVIKGYPKEWLGVDGSF